jgi:hypothetical protein
MPPDMELIDVETPHNLGQLRLRHGRLPPGTPPAAGEVAVAGRRVRQPPIRPSRPGRAAVPPRLERDSGRLRCPGGGSPSRCPMNCLWNEPSGSSDY